MPVFQCRLKEDRAGMRRGTTIEVSTPLSSCDPDKIADVCERHFGRQARDAAYPGYWEIRRIK